MQRVNAFFHSHLSSQDPEIAKQNMKRNLLLGQYFLLSLSVLEFYAGNSLTASSILTGAFYLEKAVEEYYKNTGKEESHAKAAYISANYSELSKLSEFLAPAVKEVGNAVAEDVKKIASYFNHRP